MPPAIATGEPLYRDPADAAAPGHLRPIVYGWLLLSLVLCGLLSWYVIHMLASYGEAIERRTIRETASAASAGLSPSLVAQLRGAAEDEQSAAFTRVRLLLRNIRAAIPDARFVYLVRHPYDAMPSFCNMFFRAWADANPAPQRDRPDDDAFADYLGSVSGLGSVDFLRQGAVALEAPTAETTPEAVVAAMLGAARRTLQ